MENSAVPGRAAARAASSNLQDITIKQRETAELIFAFVGPVGSGVTTTAAALESVLSKTFGYTVDRFKISSLIEESCALVDYHAPIPQQRDERIPLLQKVGSELRDKFGKAFLAEKSVERIAIRRQNNDGYVDEGAHYAKAGRIAHIIDSLKHPEEVELLRSVYGDNFWLVCVFAPHPVRFKRLKNQGLDEQKIHKIMATDEEEGPDFGQKVRDTAFHADFFIRNDDENDLGVQTALLRYVKLLFGISVATPTADENAMYAAASAATASACLSRQVGASIYSALGELIGIGCNDVPKCGGGLYSFADGASDHRCYLWGEKKCHNDAQKDVIYEELYSRVSDVVASSAKEHLLKAISDSSMEAREKQRASEVISAGFTRMSDILPKDRVTKSIKKTRVKHLIEFSRAVHAEMEAIISVARGQKAGLAGATLYSTTFPCHSCARHIVAAGIKRVVYIEPYTKSLALDLHSDAIATYDSSEKVAFVQYEGVAPKNMLKLFKASADRKSDGKAIEREPAEADLVFPAPLDGFSTREKLVVHKLRKAEEQKSL